MLPLRTVGFVITSTCARVVSAGIMCRLKDMAEAASSQGDDTLAGLLVPVSPETTVRTPLLSFDVTDEEDLSWKQITLVLLRTARAAAKHFGISPSLDKAVIVPSNLGIRAMAVGVKTRSGEIVSGIVLIMSLHVGPDERQFETLVQAMDTSCEGLAKSSGLTSEELADQHIQFASQGGGLARTLSHWRDAKGTVRAVRTNGIGASFK